MTLRQQWLRGVAVRGDKMDGKAMASSGGAVSCNWSILRWDSVL